MKIGLNVGSGQRPFTSTPEVKWINIDSQERWNPDIVADGARLSIEDGFADYVVLHHVLEHFGCGEGEGLIKEAYRVLKPGGSLLVFVPNLKTLALRWLNGFDLSTQVYMTNLYGAYMGSEDDRHKWGYTPESLNEFLYAAIPWDDVREFDWRAISGADIARDWWIIGMECVK